MSVLALVLILCFLGVIAWAVNTKWPSLNPTIRQIINIVLIVSAILITLSAFGVWQEVKGIKVPQI